MACSGPSQRSEPDRLRDDVISKSSSCQYSPHEESKNKALTSRRYKKDTDRQTEGQASRQTKNNAERQAAAAGRLWRQKEKMGREEREMSGGEGNGSCATHRWTRLAV